MLGSEKPERPEEAEGSPYFFLLGFAGQGQTAPMHSTWVRPFRLA
jgi:hypothetical protein